MNKVIETINNHRSVRCYKHDDISNELLHTIVFAAQKAPSSINGQHVTIIAIRDVNKKSHLAELAGNQPWIKEAPIFLVFCADFYRAKLAADKNKVDFEIINSLEATIIGSVDVGLAMQNAIISAESLGLGTVPIGGIRSNPEKVIELLNLPEYVFPICGLVIGYPKDLPDVKPRLPLKAVLNIEKYDENQSTYIDEYDSTMSDYMLKRTNGKENRNWSQTISNFYKNPTKRNIKKEMEKQGYLNI